MVKMTLRLKLAEITQLQFYFNRMYLKSEMEKRAEFVRNLNNGTELWRSANVDYQMQKRSERLGLYKLVKRSVR